VTVIAGTDLEVNIEAYHSTPAARQYGDLKYGDDLYGAGAGQGPPEWQPVTCASISLDLVRGTMDGARIVPVEQMQIELYDPDLDVFEYCHQGSPIISSLEVADLIRCTIGGQTIATGRIESVTEIQEPGKPRRLLLEAFGIASDYGFQMTRPARPAESSVARANALIGEQPYLADVVSSLPVKQCFPVPERELNLLQELDMLAATTAGLFRTDRNGTPRFDAYPPAYSNGITVADDCNSGGLTPVLIEWAADQLQLLNSVRVDIDTGDAIMIQTPQDDALSINLYGVHDAARGFGATVYNSSLSDPLRWAAAVLNHTSRAVHRPARIEFDTMTSTAWADYLLALDTDAGVLVKRTTGTSVPTEWRCTVSGYRLVINAAATANEVRVAGEIFLDTIEKSAA